MSSTMRSPSPMWCQRIGVIGIRGGSDYILSATLIGAFGAYADSMEICG
ncbi:MAG: hypothetical protein AB7O39_16865 [Flavobacteriaceae bacterium]